MKKSEIDLTTIKKFAAAYKEGNTSGEAEITSYLNSIGKKAYKIIIDVPELLSFMADRALIPLEVIDDYLVDISWIDYPEEIEKLLQYKKNPPPTQIEMTREKKEFAEADPKNDWITEKTEDGTLKLVSYKGNKTDLRVPSAIGKTVVSTIGVFALTPCKPRLKKEMAEQRAKIQRIEIPEGITVLEGDDPAKTWNYIGSFQGCSALETLNIPSSIKKLPRGMCQRSGISEVNLPDNLEVIEENVFSECQRLKSFNMPSHIKELQSSLFYRSALEEFHWPENEGTTLLPSFTFGFCTQLREVVLPNTLTEIGQSAFLHCRKLKSIRLPNNIRTIKNSAFYGCEALEELTIPDGVREIKEGTFNSCKKLAKLYLPATIESIETGTRVRNFDSRTFGDCQCLVIYAPEGCYAQTYALENNIPFEAATGM